MIDLHTDRKFGTDLQKIALLKGKIQDNLTPTQISDLKKSIEVLSDIFNTIDKQNNKKIYDTFDENLSIINDINELLNNDGDHILFFIINKKYESLLQANLKNIW